MAPELLRKETSNTAASDVYAFGVVLYEIFTRKDPYQNERSSEVLELVANKEVHKRPPIPRTCVPEVAQIMQECFEDDPNKRPKSEDVDIRVKLLDSEKVDEQLNVDKPKKPDRMEELLYELFPQHMADCLRQGRKVSPEKHECCTVFFSDVVGCVLSFAK